MTLRAIGADAWERHADIPPYPIWRPHPKSWKYWQLGDNAEAIVRIVPYGTDGFLWQFKSKYGFAKTLKEAAAWVEALDEHYSIPPDKRWMTIT